MSKSNRGQKNVVKRHTAVGKMARGAKAQETTRARRTRPAIDIAGTPGVPLRLESKVAIVTGAASGIGRAIATVFAREGARVSVADINSVNGKETVSAITANGGVARFIETDVSKSIDVERMIAKTVKAFGRLDVLVNNAAIGNPPAPIELVTEARWDETFAVNLRSAFLACKYSAPILKKQRSGSVINISSTAGVAPSGGIIAYVVSKGALNVLTKGLAIELAPYGVRVNCITVGGVDTPLWAQYVHDGLSVEEIKNGYAAITPLGRMGTPLEVAFAALYFASDESAFTTGTDLLVAGGVAVGSGFRK